MSELSRESSFRTALKKQKRRLSSTKAPNKIEPEKSGLPESNLIKTTRKKNTIYDKEVGAL